MDQQDLLALFVEVIATVETRTNTDDVKIANAGQKSAELADHLETASPSVSGVG